MMVSFCPSYVRGGHWVEEELQSLVCSGWGSSEMGDLQRQGDRVEMHSGVMLA